MLIRISHLLDKLDFKSASKTKSIKAKPLSQIVSDPNLFNKFLLQTIEGTQPLRPASMICLGIVGEAWPQTKEKLLKTYTITDIDAENGWLICTPKPENSVWVMQINIDDMIDFCNAVWDDSSEAARVRIDKMLKSDLRDKREFCIKGLWGEPESDGSFLQFGNNFDYVVRSKENPNDVWIVAKKIFESTYEIS